MTIARVAPWGRFLLLDFRDLPQTPHDQHNGEPAGTA